MFSSNEIVTLRNGKTADAFVVAFIMVYLKQLHAGDYVSFKELVRVCRNQYYCLSDSAVKAIANYHLGEYGIVNALAKDVVLSAVVGTNDQPSLLDSPVHQANAEIMEAE